MKKFKTLAAVALMSGALAQNAMAAEPQSCEKVSFAEIG